MRLITQFLFAIGLIMLTLTTHRMYLDIFVELAFDHIHLLIFSWGCSIAVVTICVMQLLHTRRA